MDDRKEKLINKISEIMEVGSIGESRVNKCAELLDDYVESKIVERDAFLNKMVVVSYVTIDTDYYTQPQVDEMVLSTRRGMEAVFKPEHAVCLVVASPNVRTKVEVINPKMVDEERLEELMSLLKDQISED